MSKSVVVTARISEDTSNGLDRLAVEFERSRAWVIGEAITRFITEELEFSNFLKEGELAAERGEVISHDELVASIKTRYGHKLAA